MKTLETVAVGDTVRVRQSVIYGWEKKKMFWINAVVARVTSTQFTADGDRYRKSNGAGIGCGGGAEPARQDGSDQSAEKAAFVRKYLQVRAALNTVDRAQKCLSPDHPNIDKITGLLAQIETLLSTKK